MNKWYLYTVGKKVLISNLQIFIVLCSTDLVYIKKKPSFRPSCNLTNFCWTNTYSWYVRFFRVIWIRVSDKDLSGSCWIKGTNKFVTSVDSSICLMHHGADRSCITDRDPDHLKWMQSKIENDKKQTHNSNS